MLDKDIIEVFTIVVVVNVDLLLEVLKFLIEHRASIWAGIVPTDQEPHFSCKVIHSQV